MELEDHYNRTNKILSFHGELATKWPGGHDCFNCFPQHLKYLFEVCDKTVVIVIQIKQCVWRTQLDFVFAGFREVVGSWSFTLLI